MFKARKGFQETELFSMNVVTWAYLSLLFCYNYFLKEIRSMSQKLINTVQVLSSVILSSAEIALKMKTASFYTDFEISTLA